jgi:hypothetical protein
MQPLKGFIKKALTRTVSVKGLRGQTKEVEVPPSQHLVLGVQFAIIATLCLTALEIVYILVVEAFNSEIFAAVTLVVGTILGAFFAQRA